MQEPYDKDLRRVTLRRCTMATQTQEPYKGLRPYEESDKNNFFGRETDKQVLIGKIITNKLTLLFAASGVGKSSLLQAAVMPALREFDHENIDVVYYKDWVTNPSAELKNTIVNYLKQARKLDSDSNLDNNLSLKDFLQVCTLFSSDPFIIILDQFEEFFNYQRFSKQFEPFILELAQAIFDRDTATVFVISMREDFALELSALKSYLPTVYDNLFRLEKLTLASAKQAILKPIEQVGFKYEAELLDNLLTDLSLREQIDRYGSEEALKGNLPSFIEPPHLQIICMQLWQAEQANPNKTITNQVYISKGKATGLLENYFHSQVKQLSKTETKIASLAFNYLVNKHGTKMAYPVNDLAEKLRQNPQALGKVLDKLENARILRKQKRQEVLWYELYHDIFSKSIYDWNEDYKSRQRTKKALWTAAGVVFSGFLLVLSHDFYNNYTSFHWRLSAKAGISDTIELYQGKKGSFDFFKQQHFTAEMDYARTDIEPDKLFTEKAVAELDDLVRELIGQFPLDERIWHYADIGELDEGLRLAEHTLESSNAHYMKNIGNFRIHQSLDLLVKLVGSNKYNYSNYEVVEVLGRLGSSEVIKPLIRPILKKLGSESIPNTIPQYMIIEEDNVDNVEFISRLSSIYQDRNAEILLIQLDRHEILKLLFSFLKDQDKYVCAGAVLALGYIGDIETVKPLLELLKDRSKYVHQNIIHVLGKLGSNEAVKPLLNLLKDEDWKVRSRAVDALVNLGSNEVVKPLLNLLKDQDWNVRSSAIDALGRLGSDKAVKPLLNLLKNGFYNNVAVVSALGNIGSIEAVNPLIDLLKHQNNKYTNDKYMYIMSDKYLRRSIAEALGKLGSNKAIKPLFNLLKDQDKDVRRSAVDALGKLGTNEVITFLLNLLKDQDKGVRLRAVTALGKFGSNEAVKPLIDLLKDEDVRSRAVSALGNLGNREAIKPLLELFKDQDRDVRSNVATALGNLGGNEVVKPLLELLKDQDEYVYNSAASALRNLGSLKIIDTTADLVQVSPEPEKFTAKQLAKYWRNNRVLELLVNWSHQILIAGLKKIPLPETLETIKQRTDNSQERLPKRIQAVRELGKLDTADAVTLIVQTIEKEPDLFRLVGYQTLGKVQDKKVATKALTYLNQELNRVTECKAIWRDWRTLLEQNTDNNNVPTVREKDKLYCQGYLTETTPNTYLEAEISFSIAQLDPDSQGIELLSHPLAEVRKGAWLGIGLAGKVKIIEKLLDMSRNSHDDLFRRTAYRAIDNSLITLEKIGKQEDFSELKALQQELAKIDTKSAVSQRVEWAVGQMERRLNHNSLD